MNAAEAAFAEWAIAQGWRVTKAGWPDFMCYRDGRIMAVEVKWSDGLSAAQGEVSVVLATHGIPTFVWSPPGPLIPLGGLHGQPSDAYGLSIEVARLTADLLQHRDDVAQMEADLAYLVKRASWLKDRPERLLDIFRRYPRWVRKVPRSRRIVSETAA